MITCSSMIVSQCNYHPIVVASNCIVPWNASSWELGGKGHYLNRTVLISCRHKIPNLSFRGWLFNKSTTVAKKKTGARLQIRTVGFVCLICNVSFSSNMAWLLCCHAYFMSSSNERDAVRQVASHTRYFDDRNVTWHCALTIVTMYRLNSV